MRIEHIETPALILEKSVFEANMQAMQKLLAGKTLRLRPHYKSHKCAEIAHMQIASGAIGMTCAKLTEAEDLADSGIEDILIANQVVEPAKIARLAHLAHRCRLTVCVDDEQNIDALAAAAASAGSVIHCLVEYEIGLNRCGVTTHEAVVSLAARVAGHDSLTFDGVQAYAGHLSHETDGHIRREATARNAADLRALLGLLEARGLPAKTLSGGSTGTSLIKAEEGLYTELQAGSYLMMDATYRDLDLPFRNSLFILSTVLSSRPGLVIVDAGVKSCGVDQGMPVCVDLPCREISACEEHFQLFDPERQLPVGGKVRLIPGHCCSTMNLHDRIYLVDGEKVVRRLHITARGASR